MPEPVITWNSATHIGHQLYVEVVDDGNGRPRWLLRRHEPGDDQAMVISGRSAQRLIADYLRKRRRCPSGEALGEAARALKDEVIRRGLLPPK